MQIGVFGSEISRLEEVEELFLLWFRINNFNSIFCCDFWRVVINLNKNLKVWSQKSYQINKSYIPRLSGWQVKFQPLIRSVFGGFSGRKFQTRLEDSDIYIYNYIYIPPRKFNIAPEKWWYRKTILSFWGRQKAYFQGAFAVKLREGTYMCGQKSFYWG